jgi:oligopeptide transport system permease protein
MGMRTIRYFLGRFCGAVATLLAIVTHQFLPDAPRPGRSVRRGANLPPMRWPTSKRYGLDQPLWIQYGRYLGALAHGDFGPSFRYRDVSVTELIGQGLPVSATLGAIALGLALLFGVRSAPWPRFIEALGGRLRDDDARRRGHRDPLIRVAAVSRAGVRHLSCIGCRSPAGNRLACAPGVAGIRAVPAAARHDCALTRASMLEVLRSPLCAPRFAKGLPLGTVVMRHAMRPALVPVAGFLVPAVATVMTGSLVVESIAGLPGIGRYLVQGALNRDYTLVLGMVIVYSTFLIGMGLLVDLGYAWLDPRIRYLR